MPPRPTRALERALLSHHRAVAGIDEVGRGALAGPLCVGVALVADGTAEAPEGLADSKLLTPARRAWAAERSSRWVASYAIGEVAAWEIDETGVTAALNLGATRALRDLNERGFWASAAILDGTHNWLQPTSALHPSTVILRAKADRDCAVVAAASVLAKTHRDALMEALADPGYGWSANKGYGSGAHLEALRRLGVSEHHRSSWRLPVA